MTTPTLIATLAPVGVAAVTMETLVDTVVVGSTSSPPSPTLPTRPASPHPARPASPQPTRPSSPLPARPSSRLASRPSSPLPSPLSQQKFPRNEAFLEEDNLKVAGLRQVPVDEKRLTESKSMLIINEPVTPPWATIMPGVLVYLDVATLARAQRVCNTWLVAASHASADDAWRSAYFSQGWSVSSSSHPLITQEGKASSWKDRVNNRSRIEQLHWKEGKFTEHFMKHNTKPFPIFSLRFYQHLLAVGGQDNLIKVWDIETGRRKQKLDGHKGNILAIEMNSQIIVSGSVDETVKVFGTGSGVCQKTWKEHKESVSCLTFTPDQNSVFSGSGDHSVKLWNVEHDHSLITWTEHKEKVRALAASNQLLITGSSDKTIKMFDVRAGTKSVSSSSEKGESSVDSQKAHSDEVCSLYWDGALHHPLCSGSLDNDIKVFDLRKKLTALHTFEGHSSYTWALHGEGRRLVSGSWDHTVRLWDLQTLRPLRVLADIHTFVSCLQTDSLKIILGDWLGGVRIWNFGKGGPSRVERN